MKISASTIAVLKNFNTINNNILFREGNTISTMGTAKNIFAMAIVEEEFPKEVGIYDLGNLLALITLSDDQDIEFGDNSLEVTNPSGKFEYYYADPEILITPPNKKISVDEHFVFKLAKEDITTLMKAAAIVGAKTLSFVAEDGKVTLVVGDPKTAGSNSYRKVIGESEETFNVFISVDLIKVIPDNYEVVISKKRFLHFRNEAKTRMYWMACDPKSEV